MMLRWFISRTVRQATEMRKHVQRLARAQKDLISPQDFQSIHAAAAQLHEVTRTGSNKEIETEMHKLDQVALKHLKPHPNPAWRENVEVFLVAVAVAMGIRTFFLQPMKIPTGSMQPTLYGITSEDLRGQTNVVFPSTFKRFVLSAFMGTSYYHFVAPEDGTFEILDPVPVRVLPFVTKQRFSMAGNRYSVWRPVDNFFERAGVHDGQSIRKGEDVIKVKITGGDHLFVNRCYYNFRKPERGEIVIFETRGIPDLQQDTYYIKRLVGLGGDHLRIGNDQHLIVNGNRLDAATPHFENVYSFGPEYQENHYFGHANQAVGARVKPGKLIAPLFPDENAEFVVRPNHYFVMGDNTMNSFDSRYWGDFPREKVIGRASFVYWPISTRFGWGYR